MLEPETAGQTPQPMPKAGAMPAQMPDAAPDGMQRASPEEQRQYEHFVAKAMTLTYDPKFFPNVVEMLKGEGDPMEGLARTAVMIIARVATAAEKAGEKLMPDVLVHAGTEVFEDLAELSRLAKIKDFGEDPDAFEGAYFRAMDQFRVMLQGAGRINTESAQQEMARLEEMDKKGELEPMFRNLARNDPRAAKKDAPVEKGDEEEAPATGGLMRGNA